MFEREKKIDDGEIGRRLPVAVDAESLVDGGDIVQHRKASGVLVAEEGKDLAHPVGRHSRRHDVRACGKRGGRRPEARLAPCHAEAAETTAIDGLD